MQDSIIISFFTKKEAEAICRSYQHLDKQAYIIDGIAKGIIECVAVSPFDDVNKWYFLQEYKSCKHPVNALKFYKPTYFDVILILQIDGEDHLSFEDIRKYLKKKGESLPKALFSDKEHSRNSIY